MKIKRVEVIPITVPYKFAIVHAFGGRTSGNYIIVRITSDEGITGVGCSAVLFPLHSGESIDSALGNISYVAPLALIGADPFNIESIIYKIDKLLFANWLSKAPIDFALYDLKGKALNVPVYQLLGGLCRDKVPMEFIVGLDTPEKMAEKAKEYKDAGFHGVKIKSSGNPRLDLERFKQVRKAVGDNYRMNVDMNEAYNSSEALRVIESMIDMGVVFVEQPVPRRDIYGLKFIKERINIPLAVDEGGWSLDEARAVVEAKAADIFHTVPSRIGGFTKALRYRALIEANSLQTCISTYNGPGLEHAASAHFIAATNKDATFPEEPVGVLYLYGGYSTDGITGDIIKRISGRIKDGYLYKPEGPGLGVELDEAMLEKYLTSGKKPLVVE
jgi:L-alanine-DL-glutamate epimerase-like enolase superfamily enzyme